MSAQFVADIFEYQEKFWINMSGYLELLSESGVTESLFKKYIRSFVWALKTSMSGIDTKMQDATFQSHFLHWNSKLQCRSPFRC